MKEYTRKTIWISKEAYFYLNRIERQQRGCKQLSAESEERVWNRIPDFRKRCDLVLVDDDSFGGGDGTYYGRWWSWDVETLKKMLDDAGYTYEDGEPEKCLSVDLSGTLLG